MSVLIISAASIAFFHTLFGPDHYLPFIVIAKAKKWSMKRTFTITTLCGIGHVLSSIVLGTIGILFGLALHHIQMIESVRGDMAAYLLIAFGLVYGVWGLRKAFKNQTHSHLHFHRDGRFHIHHHTHNDEHAHIHANELKSLTPWILFIIFVFGPCEPLIPLFMYPAAQGQWLSLIVVTSVFSLITIATMLTVVGLSVRGLQLLPLAKFERYMHALAGFTIFLSGLAIVFLGL